jgi:hypothetical protein
VAPLSVSCLVTIKLQHLQKSSTAHDLSGPEEHTGDYRKLEFTNQVGIFGYVLQC